METKPKQWRNFWLGMLISVASLVAIFFFINPAEILAALRSAHYNYLALTGLGILAFLVIRAVRWRFMLDNEVPWWQVFHIQNIGYMFTMIFPFRIGDVARAVLIGNVPPVTLARGLSTMVVERILDMLFIVTLLPFTLAEVAQLPAWLQSGARAFGIVALAAIVVLIVAANQRPFAVRLATTILKRVPFLDTDRWTRRTDDLLVGLVSLTRPRDGFILILLSILTWLPIIFAYAMGMRAVNLEPTLAMAAFTVCAAAITIAAPSSPGQVGVFHAGVIAALQVLGQPQAESASFAFVYHALNLTIMVVMGLIGLVGTGATFSQVISTTQRFMRRQQDVSEHKDEALKVKKET